MFQQTITVFNEYKVKGKSYFFPTIFRNVELQKTHGRNISKTGVITANKAIVVIGKESMGKPFLEPKRWQEQGMEQAKAYFTLTAMKNDFFIEGEYAEIVEDYELFIHDKDNAFVITTVDKYESILPHIEIGGV